MGIATGGAISTTEMLLATALCGASYALTAGQPLVIIGSTGPALAFTALIYGLSQRLGLAFLPFYGWVGLWTAAILGLGALFSASNVVETFTRFTDDTFSALISLIYLAEAVKATAAPFFSPAATCADACLGLVVTATVYATATALHFVRASSLFTKRVRSTLADFAPTVGLLVGACASLAATARWGIQLPSLAVPTPFGTTSGRPWLAALAATPVWARWAAAVPAAMNSVLLFMDQVRRPARRLCARSQPHGTRRGCRFTASVHVAAHHVPFTAAQLIRSHLLTPSHQLITWPPHRLAPR